MKIKIKHILGGAILMSALFLGSGLFAADSIFTFAELFTNTDYRDAGNTTADWVNGTFDGLVRLPKDSTAGSASKQVNGKVLRASDGNLYYAWVDFRSGIGDGKGHIYLQKYNTSGVKQWGNEKQVDSAGTGTYINDDFLTPVPGLMEGIDGSIFVYWAVGGNLWVQKFDNTGAKKWGGDTVVNTASVTTYNFGYTPAVVDSDGKLVFFWSSGSGLYMQKIDGSGASGIKSGSQVLLQSGYVNRPMASRDSTNHYYVAYTLFDIGSLQDILYLDKFNTDGTRAWAQRTTVVASTGISSVDIATDASGNSYVVWDDYRNILSTGRDVFIQKFDSSGTAWWGMMGKQMNTDTGYAVQQNPKVKLDANGLPNVIWEDQRSGTNVDIYAQHYDTNGNKIWSSGEVKVNKGTNSSAYSEYFVGVADSFVINTQAGGDQNSLYVAWFTDRSNDFNIYSQKVTSSGTVSFGTDLQVTTELGGGGYLSSAHVQSTKLNITAMNITGARVYGIYLNYGQTINFSKVTPLGFGANMFKDLATGLLIGGDDHF